MDGTGFDFDEGLRELQNRLETLESEHHQLDLVVSELQQSSNDMLTLQRLKRQKLRLKDEISRLRGLIHPDIIA